MENRRKRTFSHFLDQSVHKIQNPTTHTRGTSFYMSLDVEEIDIIILISCWGGIGMFGCAQLVRETCGMSFNRSKTEAA